MKVENHGLDPLARKQAEGAQPLERVTPERRDGAAAERARGGDQAALSDRARQLARARQALESAPDVRAERVQSIREQIEKGIYEIPYKSLAARLLRRIGLG